MIHSGTSREWADEIIGHLQRIREAAKPLVIPSVAGPNTFQAPASNQLDPHSVAAALAEAMKGDNSVTQAIAGRALNLQQKYPQRAY